MANSTLVLTHVIFRHGQRAPDHKYPYQGDPHAKEEHLPFGPSELTLLGRKQCYHLGHVLRERYGNFLGPVYYNGIIDAKSSERSRTRISLQLVLASLFPPTPDTQIDENLNWQPIPHSSKPLQEDKIIGNGVVMMSRQESSPDFGKTSNSLEVIQCVKDELNWDMKGQFQCMVLYDSIKTQVELGLPVPEWCRNIYPDQLREEYRSCLRYNFSQKHFVVAAVGNFIQEINNTMVEKVRNIKNGKVGNTPKMFLYSAHDVNLIGLLSVLKKFDNRNHPKYIANLAFELHQIGEEFFVKIAYQNGPKNAEKFKEVMNVDNFTLPNFKGSLCRLSEFTEYIQEYFPESPKE